MNKFDYTWKFNKKFKYNYFEEIYRESLKDLNKNSSWKIFFPTTICFLSIIHKKKVFIEKITGASIINRVPLKIMIPISSNKISKRHLDKSYILKNINKFDKISINLVDQKAANSIKFLNHFNNQILNSKELVDKDSIIKNSSICFNWKKKDLKEVKIVKLKSHHLLFLNINTIFINNFLKNSKIIWQSLPKYKENFKFYFKVLEKKKYYKGFTDNYNYKINLKNISYLTKTKIRNFTRIRLKKFTNREIKKLSSEQSKWPIFFPSSVGIIGSIDKKKQINVMPCGSTTVVNRHPFQIATAISHLDNNLRYRKRFSLKKILINKKISLGIPYSNYKILNMINYMGNVSKYDFKNKINNTIFNKTITKYGPIFDELPLTYGCELIKKIKFETHTLLIFSIKKVYYFKKFNKKNLLWNGLFKVSKKLR